MEVNIGEVNSTIRATDNGSLLSVEVLERIVRVVMERLREEEDHRERVDAECCLAPDVGSEEN